MAHPINISLYNFCNSKIHKFSFFDYSSDFSFSGLVLSLSFLVCVLISFYCFKSINDNDSNGWISFFGLLLVKLHNYLINPSFDFLVFFLFSRNEMKWIVLNLEGLFFFEKKTKYWIKWLVFSVFFCRHSHTDRFRSRQTGDKSCRQKYEIFFWTKNW